MSELRLVVGAATDVGQVRDHNEDGFIVDDELGLFAVADGMGGHRGGEVASATALETLHDVFDEDPDLREAVVAANEAVFERSSNDDAVRGMGTTITAGALTDDGATLVIGHVGDSRAYLLRAGTLAQVTTDHSLVEELVAAGELTPEEAENHPRRSMITRALGLDVGVDVDMLAVDLELGDRLMLCSDGLTGMVDDASVQQALAAEPDPAVAAQALVDAANAAGGVDNITVLVIDVGEDDGIPEATVVDDAPDALPAGDDDATQAVPVVTVDDDELVEDEDVDPEPADEDEPGRGRRRFGLFGRRR